MVERQIMSRHTDTELRWLSRLHEAFQDNQHLYLVMEYFAGGDLGSLDPEQKGIPEDHVRFYGAEVVLALEELHLLGFAHRDVKPGNVMMREDGHVSLTDFGSAGRIDPKTGQLFSRTSVGTPDYVSPEALMAQQSRNGAYYGPECDWWGLGVLLWELLTGEPPFYAASLVQTYQAISNHETFLKPKFEKLKISADAKSLLKGLLAPAGARLTLEQIKAHPFFSGIEWSAMHLSVPPFLPLLSSPEDTSRFYLDEASDDEDDTTRKIKTRKGQFDGIQLPFVGFTFTAGRAWHVAHGPQPVLQRLEGSRMRLAEVEAQVAELKESCETARLVADQIRRVASTDSLGTATDPPGVAPDDLQAAYDALVQNYEFLQMHYETLLGEHADTSRQLQALLTTLQEQEETRRQLESMLAHNQQRANLDKLKIEQLVTKLSTMALASKSTEAPSDPSSRKEKQLLRQRIQEYKCLEQQLVKESLARERLEQELADLKLAKGALEREHEALLIEQQRGGRPERRPSDASTGIRSLLSLGRSQHHHSRQASVLDPVGLLENLTANCPVRLLDTSGMGRKGKSPNWLKTRLSLRESGLWAGDSSLLASLRADLFWAQPAQPGEISGVTEKVTRHTFKIRTIASYSAADSVGVQERLDKEKKMLQGAMQLRDAARTPEQQSLAQAHIEAAQRVIKELTGQSDRGNSATSQHVFLPIPGENVCDACFHPGATLKCPDCDTHIHADCHDDMVMGCVEAAALRPVLPIYLQVSSSAEVRRFLTALQTARMHFKANDD